MDTEMQKLMKLKNMESHLAALLQKIDNEIIQTDVEWMHLKNIALAQNTPQKKGDEPNKSKECQQFLPIKQVILKPQTIIDDQTINDMHLDLSVGMRVGESSLDELELESD